VLGMRNGKFSLPFTEHSATLRETWDRLNSPQLIYLAAKESDSGHG
jgi:hypothetical protein